MLSWNFRDEAKGVVAAVPAITRRTVIIWYRKDCPACDTTREAKWFDRVRAFGLTPLGNFDTYEVEATTEVLQQYKHVTVVPLYDLVWPSSVSQAYQPYGPNTQFVSIRNDLNDMKGNKILPQD